MKIAAVAFAFQFRAAGAAASTGTGRCSDVKELYRDKACCGKPTQLTGHQIIPAPNQASTSWGSGASSTPNKCAGAKKNHATLQNLACFEDGVLKAIEQAGADVTLNVQGSLNTTVVPIVLPYSLSGLCPVNVHWHLGAEHQSTGEYDSTNAAYGPTTTSTVRAGFRCKKYDATLTSFTTEYKWKYCTKMQVGETYEVHWPHSAMGACGTTSQYQTPFYDGVFCRFKELLNATLPAPQGIANAVGVQAQVFTVINDERYYYPDLIRGMIVDGDLGRNITKYTGSTTGESRSNTVCSAYAPITWQVDRECHLISASSFDKLCADMLAQKDDMSADVHPHGSRELVAGTLSGNNKQHRRLGEFQVDSMVY